MDFMILNDMKGDICIGRQTRVVYWEQRAICKVRCCAFPRISKGSEDLRIYVTISIHTSHLISKEPRNRGKRPSHQFQTNHQEGI